MAFVMKDHVLAADLGGTNLRLALVGPDGSILHRVKRSTPHDGPEAVLAAIVESARECIEARPDEQVSALGIAVPAVINPKEGILRNSPNLPFLNGFNLGQHVSAELGTAVLTDNDATLAGLGEHWLGASSGAENAICVTLGTGVGGGLVFNGEVYRGVDGSAGEIGHICVEPDGVPCGCGSGGCLEQYASATAVVRIARELLNASAVSRLASVDDITARDVFEAAKASDPIAQKTFETAGRYLGIALGGLVNVLNPEVIVLAGGMSAAFEVLEGHVTREMRKRAFREPFERVKLVRAKLGDDAGILGAARMAFLSQKQTSQQVA